MSIDSSGQVSVRGESSATTTNLQQGLAKVWAHSTADGTALSDSFNTSGITDIGTGKQRINIANDMANANFSVLCSYIENQTDLTHWCDDLTVTRWQQNSYHSGSYTDNEFGSVAFGDLA